MAKAEGWPQLDAWVMGAANRLGNEGVATPRYEAERLAAYVLGVGWGQLWTHPERDRMEADTLKRLDRALARRVGGEPLAYIEGARGFYGLELECGPGVLVPRPETETLVDVALELTEGMDAPVVLDIGTGTGAIAIAIAVHRPGAEVVATDISADALAYARRNAKTNGVDIWFSLGDLFDAVPGELRGRVDLVVSNPPYVRNDAELPVDVMAEPHVALFAGPDGRDVLDRVVSGAREWLAPGGALALEIGDPEQVDVLPSANVRDDLTGRPRVVWARS